MFGTSADEAGDIDDENGLDFDDIDDFVALLNQHIPSGMTMARMFQIIESVQRVPEPAGLPLALCFGFSLLMNRQTRRRVFALM